MKLGAQERAFIYRWFNYLLGQELSDEQLHSLQAGTFESFFAFMVELGFAEQLAQFQQALSTCQALEVPHLELAADYAQLFLLDGQNSALPYVSFYLNTSEITQHFNIVEALLKQSNLGINRVKNEPSDHLCVHLTLLVHLIEQESNAQYTFIRDQLLSWLPQLSAKADQIKTKTRFYQVLLFWLVDFLQADIH